jgi:hypothetical protein
MKTEKLFILGNNLIQAKKNYCQKEYILLKNMAFSDAGERRIAGTRRRMESDIKAAVDVDCLTEHNDVKLARIKLDEAEILYEMEKLRLQYEGDNYEN